MKKMKVRIVIEGEVPVGIWPLATLNVLLNELMFRVQRMHESGEMFADELALRVKNNQEHLTLIAAPKKRFHFLREWLARRKKVK